VNRLSTTKQPNHLAPSEQIAKDIADFAFNPYGFVLYAFPWGKPGTILAEETGPDDWQRDVLVNLGDDLLAAKSAPERYGAIQYAISSGHGTGKSAFMSWLVLWFMSTQPNPNIVATSNTRTQLMTKLWRELARWHKLLINADWFEWTATSFFHKQYKATWKANAIPWSETNPEAFAGLHEENVMVLYDEASAIHDLIWQTTDGAMTTAGALWVATGNPTRNSGRFRECFPGGRFNHRWRTWRVDSRTAKKTNKRQLQDWVDDYGEDSDFVRVRVKGQFPRAGTSQFIPGDLVLAAQNRSVMDYEDMPLVMGVDVARFGDDESVIQLRQGARAFDPFRYRGLDTMQYSAEVARKIDQLRPRGILVDGVGVGAGVVDRLRQLGYHGVIDVQAGAKAYEEEAYYNRRAEIWGAMLNWLRGEVELPRHRDYYDQLVSVEYGLDMRERIQLESKKDIKKRGLPSPDLGDGLAMTFAEPVAVAQREKFVRPKALRTRNAWRYI
jgi:hypothetical protein